MEEDCDVQIPDDLRAPPRFVVKRWAKRIETPIESVLENNVVHLASVDDAPSAWCLACFECFLTSPIG